MKDTSLLHVDQTRFWSFSLKSPLVLKCSVFKLYKWIASSCCYSTVVLPVLGHVDISFVTPLLTPAENRSKGFVFILRREFTLPLTSPIFKLKTATFHLWRKIKIAAANYSAFQQLNSCCRSSTPSSHNSEPSSQGGDLNVQSLITGARSSDTAPSQL